MRRTDFLTRPRSQTTHQPRRKPLDRARVLCAVGLRDAVLLATGLASLLFLFASGIRRLNFDEALAPRSGWLELAGQPSAPPFHMPAVLLLGMAAHAIEDPARLFLVGRLTVAVTALAALGWLLYRAHLGPVSAAAAALICLLQAAFAVHAYEMRYGWAILFTAVPILFLFVHPHPWPYMLAPCAPFLAILTVTTDAECWLAGRWSRGSSLLADCCWSRAMAPSPGSGLARLTQLRSGHPTPTKWPRFACCGESRSRASASSIPRAWRTSNRRAHPSGTWTPCLLSAYRTGPG